MFINKVCLWGLLSLAASGVQAQEARYLSDAFGLAPISEIQNTPRLEWSGIREEINALDSATNSADASPGDPENVLLFVGHKSAIAGKDKVHAVSVVLDSFGNLVSDETEVTFSLSSGSNFVAGTEFGVASELFMPAPRIGQIHAGATSGTKQSPRSEFRVVPDLVSVDMTLQPPEEIFRRETFANIETGVLKDQFGNPVGHGVNVQLLGAMQDGGYTLANGLTISDSAAIELLTRGIGAEGNFHAVLSTQQSKPVVFKTATLSAPLAPSIRAFELASIGALQLSIGPFLSDTGFMLNDGALIEVNVRFRDDRSFELSGWLRDGFLEALVPGDAASLPADFEIRAETGFFKQRIEALSALPSSPSMESE